MLRETGDKSAAPAAPRVVRRNGSAEKREIAQIGEGSLDATCSKIVAHLHRSGKEKLVVGVLYREVSYRVIVERDQKLPVLRERW